MMKKLLFAALLPLSAFAQLPDYYPYYSDVDFTLNGEALKQELATLITETHTTELIYTPDVWNALKQSDLDPANSQNVLLIYGYNDTDDNVSNDRSRDKNLSCHSSSCNGLWVREHVFARSLGNPNLEFEGPGSDAHHLRSIDNAMNGSRSNRRFTTGTGNAHTEGSDYFYPGDEWKGDVARMMMYMYLRYGSQCEPNVIGSGTANYAALNDMPDIFLEWNEQDPVSEYERNRNTVLQGMQGNRNPFIDDPYLATKIWNGPAAEDTWGTLFTEVHELDNFSLYPTLTSGEIHINNPQDLAVSIAVYNSLGQSVKTEKNAQNINLAGNSIGIYLINVSFGTESKTYKIILN